MSVNVTLRRVSDAMLGGLVAEPSRVERFLDEEGHADLGLDKEWDGIHFLLTGTSDEGEGPYNFLVAGGRRFGRSGKYVAHGFTSNEVRDIWHAMQPVTTEVLLARYDADTMYVQDIYLSPPDLIFQAYSSLRVFLEAAVRDEEALVVFGC
jgi:hypothetical protein